MGRHGAQLEHIILIPSILVFALMLLLHNAVFLPGRQQISISIFELDPTDRARTHNISLPVQLWYICMHCHFNKTFILVDQCVFVEFTTTCAIRAYHH